MRGVLEMQMFLSNKCLTPSIRRNILLYALQLMFLRVHMFWRNDQDYYLLAIVGVLMSLVPISSKVLHIISAMFAFLIFFFPNSIFYYVLYGFVQANTTFSVACLCLSLYPQSSRFLGQLEVVCLLFPCIVNTNYGLFSLTWALIMLICSMLLPEAPIDIFNTYKTDLKPTFCAIRKIVGEEDYVIIANEHKQVMQYQFVKPAIGLTYILEYIDWSLPLVFCDIPIMLKAWTYIGVVLNVQKFYAVYIILYLLCCIEYWYIAAFFAPFYPSTTSAVPDKMLNAFHTIVRIITGYMLYRIYEMIVL